MKTVYGITLHYNTGDSFSNYNEVTRLEMTWRDKNNAEKNLQSIEEHDRMLHELNEYTPRSRKVRDERIKDSYRNSPWYVEENYRSIKLISDSGKEMVVLPFWQGYFEQYLYGEIIKTKI